MLYDKKRILGIILIIIGFFLAVGSWVHNWLGIGSPRFGLIDLAVCIIGIIMVIVGVLIYRQKIRLR
jgi:nitrate reductase gamma subunit